MEETLVGDFHLRKELERSRAPLIHTVVAEGVGAWHDAAHWHCLHEGDRGQCHLVKD